jgi:Glycosyltransferase family 87
MPAPVAVPLRPIPGLALVAFCLISIAVSGRQMLWYFSANPSQTDLRIFMTGVDMVRHGEGHNLYSFAAQQQAQTRLYPSTRTAGLLPFNHLPFELLFYWPISQLSHHAALVVWAIINVGVVLLIARLLTPYTQALRQLTGIPIALYLLAFYPVTYVLGEGQDSLIFLLLLVLSLRALDNQRAFLAGFMLSLACFKFHLALLILFLVFVLAWKWRALAGFAVGGIVITGISRAIVGPSLVPSYLAMLRNQSVITPWGFIPWFMPNLRGLLQWALAPWLDTGAIQPVIFMVSVVIGVVTTWVILRKRPQTDSSLTYSVAILTTVLISYHLHMQDLAMAALPMLVLVDRTLRERTGQSDRPRTWANAVHSSRAWTAVLAPAVASLYVFRIAGEPFPVLVMRGCLLAVPILLLWIVALGKFCDPNSANPELHLQRNP